MSVTSSDQIIESGATLVNSEIVVPSSDPIEIAAVTRSQSKQEPDVDDGDTGPVTLSDETKRMLREMDMTKFKEMEEADSSLHALWMNAKQNDSRYCISNDLLYEKSRKVDDPGLLLLPEKLRDEVLYLAHNRLISGHMGISKTISRIRQHFSSPGLEQTVRKYVLSCTQYQKVARINLNDREPLVPSPIVSEPMQKWVMNFLLVHLSLHPALEISIF